ncbi:hypothetical protein BDC45DRAFT_10502 [Circinella umbellata]|nr:hypothetical protein BDC45DRAFT_10502 [Circinella umbellata]
MRHSFHLRQYNVTSTLNDHFKVHSLLLHPRSSTHSYAHIHSNNVNTLLQKEKLFMTTIFNTSNRHQQKQRYHTTSSFLKNNKPQRLSPITISSDLSLSRMVTANNLEQKRSYYPHPPDQDPPPNSTKYGSGSTTRGGIRQVEEEEEELLGYFARISDPRTIVRHLDDYIIGQEHAKKILAVAVFNHYNRVRYNLQRQLKRQQEEDQLDINDIISPHHNTTEMDRSTTTSTTTTATHSTTNTANTTSSTTGWSHRDTSYYPPNEGETSHPSTTISGTPMAPLPNDLVPVERVSSYGKELDID